MTTNKQYIESFKANANDTWQVAEDFAQDKGITHDAAEKIVKAVIEGKNVKIRRFTRGLYNGIEVSSDGYSWGSRYRSRKQFMFNAAGELYAIYG